MGIVIITEPAVGDTITEVALNSTITSWNDESTEVDETNVREEGVDRRNIDWSTDPVIEHMGSARGDFTGTKTTGGSADIIASITGLSLYESEDDVSWEVSFNAQLVGREPVNVVGTAVSPQTDYAPRYNIELYYRENASAGWTAIPNTHRRYQLRWYHQTGYIRTSGSVVAFEDLRAYAGTGWGSNAVEVAVAAWEDSYSTGAGWASAGAAMDLLNYDLSVVKVKR